MYKYIENHEHYIEIIEGIISSSKIRLDIATATLKALKIIHGRKSESIVRFFKRRAEDGLKIRILHSGVPSSWFLKQARENGLGNLENFIMRRCVRVHQKTILGDSRILYIGSANLTGAGVGAKSENRRNFEAGILTDNHDIIDRVDSLFELIWCGDMCGKCGRKQSCPIPLEQFR